MIKWGQFRLAKSVGTSENAVQIQIWTALLMAANEGAIFAGPLGAVPRMLGGGEWTCGTTRIGRPYFSGK